MTWTTLDMVITGDTEIVNDMVSGQLVPVKKPISTAAIKQRGGRIGRKRPGLVAIASSGVNPVSELSDEELAASGLQPTDLVFPLQKFTPYKLAYHMVLAGVRTMTDAGLYLSSRHFPSLVNAQEIGYTLDMLKPVLDLYKQLGIHKPEYLSEILPFFARYVGDPVYPWLLIAAKELQDVTKERGEQIGLEIFFTFCYLGYLSTVSGSQLVLKDGKQFDKQRVPHSDLLSIYLKSESILPKAFDGYLYEDEFVEFYSEFKKKRNLTNKSNWISLRALKGIQTVENFCVWFRELLKNLEKSGFGNEQFYEYFENGYYGDGDDEYDEFDFVGALYSVFGGYSPNLKEFYSQKISENLKKLYLALGTPFTITVHPLDPSKVVLEYDYQGEKVREVTDPKLHFCDTRTSDYHHGVYYGLLIPSTTRDQSQIRIRMEHWFYISQEKPEILKG